MARDQSAIDSELRLVVAVRRRTQERGVVPSILRIDQLLDERLLSERAQAHSLA